MTCDDYQNGCGCGAMPSQSDCYATTNPRNVYNCSSDEEETY